jgi:hypothetical protein
MTIARGVTPGMTFSGGTPDSSAVYGEHEVYAAKFVFREGTSPTVTCRDGGTKACDPSCYVRNFRAGPCTLTAIMDDREVKGVTLALLPGKYDCGLREDNLLACVPPQMPQTKPQTKP